MHKFKLFLAGAAFMLFPATAYANPSCADFQRGALIPEAVIAGYGPLDGNALATRVAADMLSPRNSETLAGIPAELRNAEILRAAFLCESVNNAQERWPSGALKVYLPTGVGTVRFHVDIEGLSRCAEGVCH